MARVARVAAPLSDRKGRRAKAASSAFIALATAFISLTACSGSTAKSDPAPAKPLTTSDIRVGMAAKVFSSIFYGAAIPSDGQWTRPGEIEGLRGEWTYSFLDSRLSWFVFNSSTFLVNADNFGGYLEAAQKAVASYTLRYGKPDKLVTGVLQFMDPRNGYPGYPVLKASWATGTGSLQIDYSVLGNAGARPELLFTVEVRS